MTEVKMMVNRLGKRQYQTLQIVLGLALGLLCGGCVFWFNHTWDGMGSGAALALACAGLDLFRHVSDRRINWFKYVLVGTLTLFVIALAAGTMMGII